MRQTVINQFCLDGYVLQMQSFCAPAQFEVPWCFLCCSISPYILYFLGASQVHNQIRPTDSDPAEIYLIIIIIITI